MRLSLSAFAASIAAFSSLVSALPTSEDSEVLYLEKRAARTSPPAGCISAGSGGSFSTIQAALSSIGAGSSGSTACIFIYPGTYNNADGILINYKGALTLYGHTSNIAAHKSNSVTFTRNINSATAGSLDKSAVFNIQSANFKAYNINFRNTYGKGAQAVAVAASGDRQGYYACGFYSYQDTLYARSGKQYYSNCYIEGAVDWIFGAAAAWFGECTIAANGDGYITAHSRETADSTWYVFDHSNIVAASGVSPKIYLGRPWRVLARVIYQNSDLSSIVRPEGWTTMAAGATPEYREIANTGSGASTSQRKSLTTPTNAAVSKNTLFGSDWKDWVDTTW